MALSRRQVVPVAVFVAISLGALYYVLPRVAGLDETWSRIRQGDPWWLGVAVAFELLSFASYVALFRRVLVRAGSLIGWRESYQITMAGLAATRVFATAGAGGIVLTAWALRRSGMGSREVAARMTTFMVLLYGVYMLALVLVGLGLRTGLLPGGGSPAITLVPAVFGALAIAAALGVTLLPRRLEQRARAAGTRPDGLSRWVARGLTLAVAVAGGMRSALALLRRGDPALLGAVGWWAFDIAVLWACFHAFGSPPPVAVVVMAYFVGMTANALPVPGGVGSVEGGMIGALIAFGVDAGLAIVAVLSYRAIAFWVPTIPGVFAYLGLRKTVKRWQPAPGS
jgi:putative heme transporter